MTDTDVREEVRAHYARAASSLLDPSGRPVLEVTDTSSCCGSARTETEGSCCGGRLEVDPAFGASQYSQGEHDELPVAAVAASLGCGNPMLVAELHEGETVLDLGSGGGIDVLLSARRVGERGFVYGIDMTEEMLTLARSNAAEAGVDNVEFVQGLIEDLPLPDASVDVIISNCVVNLSPDKPTVLAEMFRVLRPGGRVGISDVVAEDHLSAQERAERGSFAGCIAGALSRQEYLDGLAAAGFVEAEVRFTHSAGDGMHGALIRARKPAG